MSAIISPDVSVEQLRSTTPVSLGVMASGSGSNFEAIAHGIINGELNAKIQVLVYNNPDAKVKEKAEKLGIKAVLLNHRDFKTREELDQAIVEIFQNHGVQWVVMAGWMRIITNVLLNAFPRKVINIHPSLLPSFKGINAVEQALKAKVKITGCTVHLVDLAVDSGPILIQSAVPILDDDTPETLHKRIQVQEHLIMVRAIALLPHLENQ
ncbi:formyltetrahydrofolate-dependent phosphoribosylglycinamide formyltransferase [Cyanobacterium stanieri PCC 7202]|uniref:Phosphoribosylglycinamide formyltransferase n=1 Tax=Cyanobacterium stanieri (strain ATCC 29140 / PCC 7202) TaxID=292563 RepID=K9YN02_CYASC|nr:formyltetrahydrofolate-dependent phosphoribosylglycinamide formyltransferase [Cyanobacterium stanieri PCC 7202]